MHQEMFGQSSSDLRHSTDFQYNSHHSLHFLYTIYFPSLIIYNLINYNTLYVDHVMFNINVYSSDINRH